MSSSSLAGAPSLARVEDAEILLAHYQTGAELELRGQGVEHVRRAAGFATFRYRLVAGSLQEVLVAERDRVAAERSALGAQEMLATTYVGRDMALWLAWAANARSVASAQI